jgi:hypothetical protein
MYICGTPYVVIRKLHTNVPLCYFVILFNRHCISWGFSGRLQTVEARVRSPCIRSGFVVDKRYAGNVVFSQYFCVPMSVIAPSVFRIYSPAFHGTNNGPISDHNSTEW